MHQQVLKRTPQSFASYFMNAHLILATLALLIHVQTAHAQDGAQTALNTLHVSTLDGIQHSFTLDALDALPQVAFTTSTIWTDGDITFSGVSLKALLTSVGANGATLEMTALNDYAITMPIADLEDAAPIIATRMNGETMPIRDKGPYWVVFPFDQSPKYSTETNYSRSIWQLNRLKVTE